MTGKLLALSRAALLGIFLGAASGASSQEKDMEKDPGKDQGTPEEPPQPLKFESTHRLHSGPTDLSYTVTAEEVFLKDDQEKPTASFFTIYYAKTGDSKSQDRPLTFVFNGGPGSASIWLHFGLVGPQLIDLPSDAADPGGPPYHLRDNPWTLLRATDLVFVDPVGTGYSKPLGDKKNEDFWGYDEDADSVAEFIRTFITGHNRWNSPKYILGESYGGIRAALLVPRLQQDFHIGLNGLILISPALNMGTLPFDVTGNDLPYATHLPAYAASAYYHGKLPDAGPDRQTFLDEVESFAGTEYLTALFKGDDIDPQEKTRVAEKLHRYTGLRTEYILRSDLRIYAIRFIKELLRDEGKSVGLLDGRYTQDELDDVAEFPGGDPFSAKTGPAYVSMFQEYLRNELKVDLVKQYIAGNDEANQHWKRPTDETSAFAGYVDVTGYLAQGTKDNEGLRIFSAAGYHDLTTSYFATEYMLRHSGIDPNRLTIKNYDGGHMMYLHHPSLEAMSDDIVQFIRGDGKGSAKKEK